MKIAELFVQLGFKVEGPDTLPDLEKRLDSAAGKAGKLALGIDVITAGLGYLMDLATNAAVGLHKFALSTGLSTQEMQRWQHAAVVSNVSAEEMTETIMSLQAVHARMVAQGGSVAQPWLMLGVDPNESDPFKIGRLLAKGLSGVDKDLLPFARIVSEQAGIGANVFQAFRRPEFLSLVDSLKDTYVWTDRDQKKLTDLNREWLNLQDLAKRTSGIFMSEMAPALTKVVDLLTKFVEKLAEWSRLLEGDSTKRHAMQGLVIGIGVLSFALTGLAGALKALSIFAGTFNLVMAPWLLNAVAIGVLAESLREMANALERLKNLHPSWKEIFKAAPQAFGDTINALTPGHPAETLDRLNNTKLSGGRPWWMASLNDLIGHSAPRSSAGSYIPIINIDRLLLPDGPSPESRGRAFTESLRLALTYAGSNAPSPSL